MASETQRPDVPLVLGNEEEHRRRLALACNAALPHDGSKPMTAPLKLFAVTVADLATAQYDAELWPYAQVLVTDETGGAVPAFSDGTDWRRVTDRSVVS